MSKAKRQKKFNANWLEEDDFKSWLKSVPEDETKFRCSVCKKNLSLSSSGRGAVVDHAKGLKHTEAAKKIKNFFQPSPAAQQRKINQMATVADEDKLKAQVVWLMKGIDSGYSNNSNNDIGDVLQRMDPESKIFADFKMKKTKAAYVVNFGLAPYYRGLLHEEIGESDMVAVSFDESHNDVVKKGEMVIMVRYWSTEGKCVKVRYLDSSFLGHATENDLLVHFNKMCSQLDRSKVYHISMDGPHVNHSFFRSLKKNWETDLMHHLVDIGVCNLHIISGAFKTGAIDSGWKIHKTLKGAWQMFHEAPARREDYTLVTSSESFPQFFAATRWVENQEPADHLVQIWPNIQRLWTWWKAQKPLSKQPCSLQNKTMLHMKDALSDHLTTAKLHFFSFIAGKLQPFLVKYQTDKPMIPYLYRDLENVLKSLFSLIVKKNVLDDAKTGGYKKVDLYKKDNLVKLKNVEIGFAADHTIKQLKTKDVISSSTETEFREQCVTFVRSMIVKMLDRSPIDIAFLRYTAIFNPSNLVSVKKEKLGKILKALLSELHNWKIIDISRGDKIIQEFNKFYDEERTQSLSSFQGFSEKEHRLDSFYFDKFQVGEKYPHLSFVLRLIMTMSHGQSSVERNFSLKNNLEEDNQSEITVVARRICKDHMVSNKVKPHEVVVDKNMLLAVKSARRKYVEHLEEEQRNKKTVEESVQEIEAKKKKEEIEQVDRDILVLSTGVKVAETEMKDASKALETICRSKKPDNNKLISIQTKLSGSLKRKDELATELQILKKRKDDLEA